jgi:hypothetical protein
MSSTLKKRGFKKTKQEIGNIWKNTFQLWPPWPWPSSFLPPAHQ